MRFFWLTISIITVLTLISEGAFTIGSPEGLGAIAVTFVVWGFTFYSFDVHNREARREQERERREEQMRQMTERIITMSEKAMEKMTKVTDELIGILASRNKSGRKDKREDSAE